MTFQRVQNSALGAPHLRVVGRGESAEEREEPEPSDFDAIFRRYAPYVGTIALRILGNPAEVDDLIQDVFLVVHDDIATLKEPEKLRGWLATIAVRKSMNRLRRSRLRRFLALEDVPSFESLCALGATPEQRLEVNRIYQRLETLSASERTVWVLRHVQGSTLDEIEEFTGLSRSTVQRRLKRTERYLEWSEQDD